jgi:hypothetical protein
MHALSNNSCAEAQSNNCWQERFALNSTNAHLLSDTDINGWGRG